MIIINLLLITILGLIPAYIYPSGGYQIVDVPLVIIIIFSLLFLNIHFYKIVSYMIPFALWVILVISYHYVLSKSIDTIIPLVPILYSILILITFINIFVIILNNKQIYTIYAGLLLSLFITFFVKGANNEYGRQSLSFNDPNQLGYFSVILLIYIILLFKYKSLYNINNSILTTIDFIIIITAHYFMLLSVSRTSMIAVLFIDIFLIKIIYNKIGPLLTLIFFFNIFIIFFIQPDFVISKSTFVKTRLDTRPHDDFTEKGIIKDVIFRTIHPLNQLDGIQVLIGKGQYKGMESHNIIFEVIRGYGLIGAAFLLYWIWKAIKMARKVNECLFGMSILLLFNMSIYGIRWRGFWILLGFLFAIVFVAINKNNLKKNIKKGLELQLQYRKIPR